MALTVLLKPITLLNLLCNYDAMNITWWAAKNVDWIFR